MASISSPQPPPPYSTNLQRPPSYYGASNTAYSSDPKTPAPATYPPYTATNQPVPYVTPSSYTVSHSYDAPYASPFPPNNPGAASAPIPTSIAQPESSHSAVGASTAYSHYDGQNISSVSICSDSANHPLATPRGSHPPQTDDTHESSSFHVIDSSYISNPGEDVYNMKTVVASLPSFHSGTVTAQHDILPKPSNPGVATHPGSQRDETKPHTASIPTQPIAHSLNSNPQLATPASGALELGPQQSHTLSQKAYRLEYQLEPSSLPIPNTYSPHGPDRAEVAQNTLEHAAHPYLSPPVQPAPRYTAHQTGNIQHQPVQSVLSLQPWRHSLQQPVYPSPLSTLSQQVTPAQSPAIPYFPPPPGQQGIMHSPATYATQQASTQGNGYHQPAVETQYPPVPIPSPYSTTAPSTPYQGQAPMPAQHQQYPPIPHHSKPQQQVAPTQYQVPGYPQYPLTPPYSPPQTTQHGGTGYFPSGAIPQYQNMYQGQHR